MKKLHKIEHKFFDNDSQGFEENIQLKVLQLSSVCLQYFNSPHKAIWIDNTIFLKGTSQTILRIKYISEEE